MDLKNEEKWKILNAKVQRKKVIDAFTFFRNNDIEPILIKGVSVERFYPKNVTRLSFDIDLSVSPTDYTKAVNLLESKALAGINIDLHKGLRHQRYEP